MAYEKQEWTAGEIITATKLNHIENGLEEIGNTIIEGEGFFLVKAEFVEENAE